MAAFDQFETRGRLTDLCRPLEDRRARRVRCNLDICPQRHELHIELLRLAEPGNL